jgi:general secretion pathway protein K
MKDIRGAALILAMLVAALAATVAVALAGDQQRWFADVANRREQVQAQSLALAGVQWARQILADDAARGSLDFLGEPWSYPLPPTPIAEGSIEGRIEDAQGRLNLNNAAMDGTAGLSERARLAQLFASKGVDPKILEALAPHVPLTRTAELSLVRGASAQAWAALAPDVSALPPGTQLNVNTANADVIAAAIPELTGDKLATFIAERARKPFTTRAELASRLPRGVVLPEASTFAFSSSFFLVSVRSRQGDAIAQARALLKRDGQAWPTVIWQTLE